MHTIDNLLLKIVNNPSPTIEEQLSSKDSAILRSLASAVNAHHFITENQSRLLMKILKINQDKIANFKDDIESALTAPLWSRRFRQIDQIRKLYIFPTADGMPVLAIEFTFSNAIRKLVHGLNKNIETLIQVNPGKLYYADLTEKNIVTLVDALSKHNFQIDEKVQNHYNIIKSWSEDEIKNQFLITSITNPNFQKHITADLGVATPIDKHIINDRKIRYQYFAGNDEKPGENLTELLANRTRAKVWVDSNAYSLDQVIESLIELKRLPLLLVFDSYDANTQYADLEKISKILDNLEITEDVGIYFRLPNTLIGKQFNDLISQRKYNSQLDASTKIVGVTSGKIPKFFISNDWKPMSVVAINAPLRHSKTAVYANCCDLIISYSSTEPIIEKTDKWL